jgi:superfamily II DNA or RNA helicase
MPPPSPFLDSVREACRPAVWTQAVKLARGDAVQFDKSTADEVVARVRTPGRAIAPTVVLYPEGAEWTCDCDAPTDPCAHVAAATIVWHRVRESGEASGAADKPRARLSYRFYRPAPATLALDRFVVHPDGSEQRLERPLASIVAASEQPSTLTPTQDDLAIDRVLGAQSRGTLALSRIGYVLDTLASADDVRFEGQSIRTSGQAVVPKAVVRDAPAGGVVLSVEADPSISEVVAPGVALSDGTLRPLSATDLTGVRLERLPLRRTFSRAELGELATKVLPGLDGKSDLRIETDRLPERGRAVLPRIDFEISWREQALDVLPLLVYGAPVQARIDAGRLVHLQGTVPRRDEAAEHDLCDRLRSELNLVPGRRVRFEGLEATRLVARLRDWQKKEDPEKRVEAIHQRALVPRVVIDGDRLTVNFELESDGESKREPRGASAEAVLGAFQLGLDVVALESGGWAPLPVEWLTRHAGLITEILDARQPDGKLPSATLPMVAELCSELGDPPPPRFSELVPLLGDFRGLPEAELPEDLRAVLRPYQRQGVNWLSFLDRAGLGAVLADDMGLGKTLQALCAARGKTLIVAPRSVVYNWLDEIARFLPLHRSELYHGAGRKLGDADFVVTTYAILRLDIDTLAARRWDTVVLDEAQAIKNPDSQVARAAYRLDAGFRMSLSGTPIENRLEELYSQMHFTNRGLLGSRADFAHRYEEPILAGDAAATARLRRRIRPFVLRRLKSSVAPELPARTDVVLHVELEEQERSFYEAVHAATKRDVVEKLGQGASMLAVLEALLRLRQAACHPALVPGAPARLASSSKLERLVDSLSDAVADGHKALVFSQWTSLLDLVEPLLEDQQLRFTRLDGSTRDRAGVVQSFQSAEGPPVLIASLKAGGTGLNLTAADHVFLLDPWWNPAAEDQAADRAHRIGQQRPVFVYRLVAKDTIEERILALQERKRALAAAALEDGALAAQLTKEDLLELLS